MEFETEEYTKKQLTEDRDLGLKHIRNLRFLITSGVMTGVVIEPSFLGSDTIYAANTITGRDLSLSLKNVRLVKNFTGTYIPDSIYAYYAKSTKSQTEALDKFGGIVTIDSIVAYIDHKKSADESLRVGTVIHISKAGVVTLRDIVDNTKRKLVNSKRHFLIDEDILKRLMILQLGKKY